MEKDYKGLPPLDDEAWLEEELKREAAIFGPGKGPAGRPESAVPQDAAPAEQPPPSLEEVPLPPDTFSASCSSRTFFSSDMMIRSFKQILMFASVPVCKDILPKFLSQNCHTVNEKNGKFSRLSAKTFRIFACAGGGCVIICYMGNYGQTGEC